MLESFFGSVIFEAIGAFVRWTFMSLRNRIKGKPTPSFKKVWQGRKKDFQEHIEYGVSNIVLGMGVILFIIIILKVLDV